LLNQEIPGLLPSKTIRGVSKTTWTEMMIKSMQSHCYSF